MVPGSIAEDTGGSLKEAFPAHDPAGRIILHLDMDSFYASVEVRHRPELAGKPVVIGADPKQGHGRGVVSTCSYEARAFGIRSAMPISHAFVLCPHATYLPPDFARYSQASTEVMRILRSYGFRLQQVSIDEAFLDLTPVGSFESARSVAAGIRDAIKSKLGLTCSVGLASSRVVAKIASDVKKPDGLTIVRPHDLQEFLDPLPVRKIPGIGKKSEAGLSALGIRTIGDLARYDVQELIGRFGRGARVLHQLAQGIDDSEVEEYGGVKSVSREMTFETDTDDAGVIVSTIDDLAVAVHEGLVQEQLRFRTVTVKVRYQGFVTRTKSCSLSHFSGDRAVLQSVAHTLFRDMYDSRKIRLLGIRLSSFEKQDEQQMVLPL
jgi:DNA polymerase IV (DinB-like DNA polymerase)